MRRWAAAVAVVVVLGFGVLLALSIFGPSGPPHVAPPAGFTAGVEQSPAVGVWRATGTTTSSAGYLGSRDVGETITRRWRTTLRCEGCSSVLTIEHADGTRLSSPLTPQDDGWHATFNRRLPCKVVDGRQVTWNQRSSFVLRFTNGGRRAAAHQVNLSYAKRCGYATSRDDWTAVLATAGAKDPRGDAGPVLPNRGHVNRIGEAAMAASLGRAVRADAAAVRAQAAEAIDRPVRLELLHRKTLCRSRVNTPTPGGVPFECLLVALDADERERFVIDILVVAIEGRCWRAVATAVKGADRRWVDFDKAAVERVLGRAPLRGCA